MKTALLIMLIVLAVSLGSAAMATTVGWSVSTSGIMNIYTYYLTSSEASDVITSFHIYAPTLPTNILPDTTPVGWRYLAEVDSETGGADISWTATNTSTYGLTYGKTLQVSMKASSSLPRLNNYSVPGYLGNWGYESANYAGWGAFTMFPAVAVPSGMTTASVPEPGSLAALALGCIGIILRKR